MRRKRCVFGGALVVALALSVGGLPSVASASTTVGLTLTTTADYSCVGPCATATSFSVEGIAHSGAQGFGTMTYALGGTVLGVLPDGCAVQTENWAFTTKDGKNTIFLSTTSDTICPTANPNALLETGTLMITGGTGLFSTATGTGSFVSPAVLVHPQKGTGTVSLTITY
jgi:hypothetical protein